MRLPLYALGALSLLVAGCDPDGSKDTDGSDAPADPRVDRDTLPGPDDVPSADDGDDPTTDSDSGTAGDTDTSEDAGPPVVTRFIALGDAGTGNDNQRAVADAAASVCAQRGCDFAVYLGDNFYDNGVISVTDSQWQDKFETPYAALDIPFWAVIGNHDYGGNGGGWEPYRTDAQVEYTAYSGKWRMPDQYYASDVGQVTLFGLDTNALVWGRGDDQAAWFPGARDAAQTRWKIALGHHPYVSNGPHGDAGQYDGSDGNGAPFEQFASSEMCGKVDVYFCGHDHSLQWPVSPCPGTEFIVSGASGKTSSIDGSRDTYFESAQLGFMYVEIVGDDFTGTFYDTGGNELFKRSFTRSRR